MTQLNAALDGAQLLEQLAHALRQHERYYDGITDGGRRGLGIAIGDRYELCCDLGMGADAGALVLMHRFKVAGR